MAQLASGSRDPGLGAQAYPGLAIWVCQEDLVF